MFGAERVAECTASFAKLPDFAPFGRSSHVQVPVADFLRKSSQWTTDESRLSRWRSAQAQLSEKVGHFRTSIQRRTLQTSRIVRRRPSFRRAQPCAPNTSALHSNHTSWNLFCPHLFAFHSGSLIQALLPLGCRGQSPKECRQVFPAHRQNGDAFPNFSPVIHSAGTTSQTFPRSFTALERPPKRFPGHSRRWNGFQNVSPVIHGAGMASKTFPRPFTALEWLPKRFPGHSQRWNAFRNVSPVIHSAGMPSETFPRSLPKWRWPPKRFPIISQSLEGLQTKFSAPTTVRNVIRSFSQTQPIHNGYFPCIQLVFWNILRTNQPWPAGITHFLIREPGSTPQMPIPRI